MKFPTSEGIATIIVEVPKRIECNQILKTRRNHNGEQCSREVEPKEKEVIHERFSKTYKSHRQNSGRSDKGKPH